LYLEWLKKESLAVTNAPWQPYALGRTIFAMRLTMIILCFAIFSANAAFYKKKEKIIPDTNVGCGAGQYVMKDSTVFSLTCRYSTNHIISTQLFGISSGTSGCRKHQIVKKDRKALYFAERNWEFLQFEMSMGQGEYLRELARLLKTDYRKLAEYAQSHFLSTKDHIQLIAHFPHNK
jgi:hypothetical protein